jgi:hypothetical protein
VQLLPQRVDLGRQLDELRRAVLRVLQRRLLPAVNHMYRCIHVNITPTEANYNRVSTYRTYIPLWCSRFCLGMRAFRVFKFLISSCKN